MSNFPLDSFDMQQEVKTLLGLRSRLDKLVRKAQKTRKNIEQQYSPRAQFKRWRDSIEGKSWKRQQYAKQNGCCCKCKTKIKLKGSHIDHIEPLTQSPLRACDPNNLQILCAGCNARKGSRLSSGSPRQSSLDQFP